MGINEKPLQLKPADYASDQEVRWCPGCGDYAILNAVKKTLADKQAKTEKTVFVSGIGCSSRLPYYMATYGFHTIHGRAPAFATGIKLTNPELDVWIITGDGDSLSIGGNHFIHLLRKNLNCQILLFNNEIYGLTKGQYSPTSEVGKITKSTPMGSVDQPFNAASIALGAEATFVARTHDMDRKHMQETFKRAHAHRGSSLVEIYQNCNVFNDGAFGAITKKDKRDSMLIQLTHGEPVRFGADKEFGVISDQSGNAQIVKVADVGESSLIVHDEGSENPSMAFALSRLASGPYQPTPMGVFREVKRPEYGKVVNQQIDVAKEQNGEGNLHELLRSQPTWTV